MIKRTILLLLLLLLSNYIFADLSGNINQKQFIAKIINFLTNDKTLETSKIDVAIKHMELQASKKNYEKLNINLSINLGYDYKDDDRITTSTTAYNKRKITLNRAVKISASKRFLNNPSNLSLSLEREIPHAGIERYKQNLHISTYETDNYDSVLKASWKYPLLKHDSNASLLKTYHHNILDFEKQNLSFYEDKENFIADKLQDYLTWAFHYYEVQFFTKHLQALNNIIAINNKQKLILQNAISKAENNVINAQNDVESIQKKLAIALDDDQLLTQKPVLNWTKNTKLVVNLINYLKKNNRDLYKYKIQQALKKIDIDYYKNQNLAKLDFSISAEESWLDGNTQSNIYNENGLKYNTALLFEYPLFGNTINESNFQVAELGMKKLRIAYSDKLQDLHVDLSLLDIAIRSDKQSIKRYAKLIEFAVKNKDLEQENFTKSHKLLRVLLAAFDEEIDSKISHLSAVIDNQRKIIKYDNLLDRIIIYKLNYENII